MPTTATVPATPVRDASITTTTPNAPRKPAATTGYLGLGNVPAVRQPVFGTDDEELGIAAHFAASDE